MVYFRLRAVGLTGWLLLGTMVTPGLPPARAQVVSSDRQAEADRLLEQGIRQWQTGQVSQAMTSLQQALTLFEQLNDTKQQAKTIRNLGTVYYLLANYQQAIAHYQRSLALARQIGNGEAEASALNNLGAVSAGLGNYQKANDYYQQALPIYRRVGDRLGEGQVLGNLAEVAYGLSQPTQAIDYGNQAIAIAREVKDVRLEANTIGLVGIVYDKLSDYAKARELYQQQLAMARQNTDPQGEAAALNNLGTLYHTLGNFDQAIQLLEQRVLIARRIQDKFGEASSLKNLSSVYDDVGNTRKAIDYIFKALAIAQEIKNPSLEASVTSSLGNLYLELLDYDKAIAYHTKYLALKQAANSLEGEAIAYVNLGNAYKVKGDVPKAIQYHKQVLAIARQLKNPSMESTALLNLAVHYDDLQQYDTAIAYHQQALAIARATHDQRTEAIVLNNLGNTLFKLRRLPEAETTLAAGLTRWESLRSGVGSDDINKISIFEQQLRTYRTLQRVLVAQNKTDAALEIAERGRARALVELLSRGQRGIVDRAQATVQKAISLDEMRAIAKAQNSTLVEYSIAYEDVVEHGKIKPRESELYIWAIAPKGDITFRTVNLKQQKIALADLVETSRSALGVRGRGLSVAATNPQAATSPHSTAQEAAKSQQLYQTLIAPIADVLPKDPTARVTVIPQGSLFLVPFAALKDPTGKYLIEQHTLLTAPSIEVLAFTHRQKSVATRSATVKPRSSLVVGNPTMPTVPAQFDRPAERLQPLPGAEQEARAIAELLGTPAIIGRQATKAVVMQQMQQQQIIHLATHGLLDDLTLSGVPGAIALAPTGQDNGLLTSNEISQLKLQANLVVLSACDTGRGRISGDGVIGLSRAFISAGAPSLVVSLWSVPDAPTAALMTEFYQTLKRSPDKAQALRQAMLKTMQNHPDPLDWAAFTLIGEAD